MSLADLVLFVHIVAACVWIGGQITVAAVLPLLRGDPGLIAAVGHRFARLAWTAFGVLVVTGVLNVTLMGWGVGDLPSTGPGRILLVKLGFVVLSGLAAAVHAGIQAPRRREAMSQRAYSAGAAVLGSVALLSALAAALFGVLIARG